jgi:hypothetical protein
MTDDTSNGSILVGGIALDNAYAGFTLGKVTNNESEYPGYGFNVAYNGGQQGEATVYVYNKGQGNIGYGPLSSAVLSEFNQATREVLSLKESADRKIELVSRYGTGSPERGKEFLCAEFILSDGFGSRRTFVYITGVGGNFLKIRVTLRTNDEANPMARDFADAVAAGLRWK